MYYKIYILLGCLLALVACAKQAPPPATPHASLADCWHVYQQILNDDIVDFLDPALAYSPNDWVEAQLELDNQFQASGAKDKFFRACQTYMTTQQVDCAVQSLHAADMNNCIKLYPNKGK